MDRRPLSTALAPQVTKLAPAISVGSGYLIDTSAVLTARLFSSVGVWLTGLHPLAHLNYKKALVLTHSTPYMASSHPLEHIAHRDAVTNLPNRFLLADRVRQALYQCQRRGQSLAMAYVDLDGLRAIGETHGPAVCDAFLIAITQRMKVVLREGDTLARIGAEEFVAVLVDLDAPQDCEPVLSRLVSVASEPATIKDQQMSVTATIGVILSPDGAVDVDLLLRHADQALYHAPTMGKSHYQLFDIDLNAAAAS